LTLDLSDAKLDQAIHASTQRRRFADDAAPAGVVECDRSFRRARRHWVLEEGSPASTTAPGSAATGNRASHTASTTAAAARASAGASAGCAEAVVGRGSVQGQDAGPGDCGTDRCAVRLRPVPLQKNADYLRRWTTVRVTVEGHADARGTTQYNLALGQRRAAAIRDYLVGTGIATDRLVVVSKGEEQLVCSEDTDACHDRNRRGHFIATAK
jgi:peptidoglycan-associated lipoprotein